MARVISPSGVSRCSMGMPGWTDSRKSFNFLKVAYEIHMYFYIYDYSICFHKIHLIVKIKKQVTGKFFDAKQHVWCPLY